MRKTVASFIVIAVALSVSASAQTRDQKPLTADAVEAERSTLIGEALDLTSAEAKAFWPLYGAYRKEIAAVNGRRFQITMEFVQKQGKLTDEEATRMLADYIGVERDYLGIDEKYAEEFSRVLPPQKVIRLFQAENKLNTRLAAELTKSIPLAR
jgi:membrane-bound ClpP family serine protease